MKADPEPGIGSPVNSMPTFDGCGRCRTRSIRIMRTGRRALNFTRVQEIRLLGAACAVLLLSA